MLQRGPGIPRPDGGRHRPRPALSRLPDQASGHTRAYAHPARTPGPLWHRPQLLLFVSANMCCPAIFAILANPFLQCQSPVSSNAPSTPATAIAPCRADYHRSMSKPATTIRQPLFAVVSVIVSCDHDAEPARCSLLFNITFAILTQM